MRRTLHAAGTARAALALAFAGLVATAARGNPLEAELGRSEVRVLSAPAPLAEGRTVVESGLLERLEALGYERVHERPVRPGQYFWGHEVFWIWRRPHRHDGRDHEARLFGLSLRRSDGRIGGGITADGVEAPLDEVPGTWLEPEVLAESLDGDRAPRRLVALRSLPEHVWRPVLAAEDARFFDHPGVDARSIARALLANVRAGGVEQGGSTITQQLVKNRDLTPKRTVGRKASEALRSLALELEHDKQDILEAYLNSVYLGHVDGLAVHGLGAAARAYFSRDAGQLDLAKAALLAALIQGPNRLSPLRHPERARARRDWVLSRMEELGWATEEGVDAARRAPLGVEPSVPPRRPARELVRWAADVARDAAPARMERGRGVVVETSLDPHLQRIAEDVVSSWLARLRVADARLRRAPLQAALVCLEAQTGAVLAHVGSDPDAGGAGFDRARNARRQPGSIVKPLVLLEAFESCAGDPLHPASRVADQPLAWPLPAGDWSPVNPDGGFRGEVTAREALVDSLNVPFVRIGRECGLEETGRTFLRAGLPVPDGPPPSLLLGSVEATPVEVASAYTTFGALGTAAAPLPVTRVERPGGRRLESFGPSRRDVARPAAAWLVRDVMRDAVLSGTALAAAVDGVDVAAKTGTSSESRDAWMAGTADGLVTVVWIGLDDGGSLGLSGARAAGTPWREFMERAVPARPPRRVERPNGVVTRWIDLDSGLLVRDGRRGSVQEVFRRDALPRRRRFWRNDEPVPVVR